MKNKGMVVTKSILALSALTASTHLLAEDYSEDIYKNDYQITQLNLLYAINELPGNYVGEEITEGANHLFLEMEMAARSGILDFYGYVDVYNLGSDADSDKEGSAKVFIKAAPRLSIDGMTGQDLSFGPVKELYISSDLSWDGDSSSVTAFNDQKIGFGADVMVPIMGKMGLNLYATYESNAKDWNGYQVSMNWFTPIYGFENGSYIAYQGYLDYQFAMEKTIYKQSTNGGVMYNGLFWHSDHFAVGYVLTGFKDVYGFKDGVYGIETTGIGHYLDVSYKF